MPDEPWMRNWEDYYKILQVDPSAEPEVIDVAFRRLARKYHPDVDPSPKATEKMTKINTAHEVLIDPIKRRAYDQVWREHKPRPGSEQKTPPPPPPTPANIVLSNFSISPQRIQLGNTVSVSLTATNTGGTMGSKTINMTGDFINSRTVKLGPGVSTIVQFTVNPSTVGTFNITVSPFTGSFAVTAPSPPPASANIVLSDFLISSQQILLGDSVNVSVTAINKGGGVGSKTIAMLGDFINSQTVTLNPGASTTVSFAITPDKTGRFSISLGPFTGSFSVTVPSKSVPVLAKWLGGLLVVAIAIGLSIHFWPTNTPAIVLKPTPTYTPTPIPTPISYAVGIHPWGVCSDGANIWVSDAGSNTVTKLKASDGSLVGTYAVGTNPVGICFDGVYIWVTNFGSNTVTKL
jgi:hypothetical protein